MFMSAILAIIVPAHSFGIEEKSPFLAQADGSMQENSGLRGWTIVTVGSGAENGLASKRKLRMEFAVLPINGETSKFANPLTKFELSWKISDHFEGKSCESRKVQTYAKAYADYNR